MNVVESTGLLAFALIYFKHTHGSFEANQLEIFCEARVCMFGRWDVVAVYCGGSVQKVCWRTVEKKVRPSAKQNVCGFNIYYGCV
jgi:hypothetical protein